MSHLSKNIEIQKLKLKDIFIDVLHIVPPILYVQWFPVQPCRLAGWHTSLAEASAACAAESCGRLLLPSEMEAAYDALRNGGGRWRIEVRY